jgi:hypothetical protein
MRSLKLLSLLFLCILDVSSAKAGTPLRISQGNNGDSGCDLFIANFDNIEEFTNFFSQLKLASKTNDAKKIADSIIYPLTVKVEGKPVTLKNSSEFLNQFKKIWTKDVSSALAGQEVSKLFCNYQGVMIGNGQIWIKKIKTQIGVGAINL